MNTKRIIVLCVAGVMAIVAALLARGMMGGGTPKVEAKIAPQMPMSDVLVASGNLQPGQALAADLVHWQKWPSSSVDASFITRGSVGSVDDVVKGTVVRSPLTSGQPVTNTAIVHASAAGFMAAMLNPGMRAISITISADSGAGGFILPNDRIDLILTRKGDANRVTASIILADLRVLAVDQTFKQDKDTKTVVGKTATLEVTPAEAELVAKAQSQGVLSLALRPLDNSGTPVASNASSAPRQPSASASSAGGDLGDQFSIIRYGLARASATVTQGGKPQ
ncbi:MAG TPA: Flp pilus assembly protein CpaB [Rhizomicrobium sp.]|jgi:pilus assembly protein CpaB|nr:Flp pilus assembly protein CpaB [Rhizomicrobium sp.]